MKELRLRQDIYAAMLVQKRNKLKTTTTHKLLKEFVRTLRMSNNIKAVVMECRRRRLRRPILREIILRPILKSVCAFVSEDLLRKVIKYYREIPTLTCQILSFLMQNIVILKSMNCITFREFSTIKQRLLNQIIVTFCFCYKRKPFTAHDLDLA